VDLANFLNSMGANIMGAGTDVIKIRGVERLGGGTYSIIPDQIEAGTYMAAVAATGGEVRINNVIPMHKGVEICPYIRPVKTVKRWSLDRQGVAWVQWHLNRHGFDCAIDGSFGAKTLERVKEFQRSRGLEDDGKCGPLTRAALED